MTDIQPIHPPTFEEFVRFLKAHNNNAECSFCKGKSFSVLSDPDGHSGLGIPSWDGESIMLTKALLALALECNACGRMEFHSVKTAIKWLASNPDAAPND